jgi:hypothetical protein
MKFACIQQYFDNGKVSARVQSVPDDREDSFTSNKDEDLYIDIFETKVEAEKFAAMARKA